jgi:hypothetical protein
MEGWFPTSCILVIRKSMKHLGSQQWWARVHDKECKARMSALAYGKRNSIYRRINHSSIYRHINHKYAIVALSRFVLSMIPKSW